MRKSIDSSPSLEKGQRWHMPDSVLQIDLVGKRLVHYRHFKSTGKRASSSLSIKGALAAFLKKNKAILVQE